MNFRPTYKIVTTSNFEPVSYDEAAEHLRVDTNDDRAYINELLKAAREYVEGITGVATVSATYRLTAPDWDSITIKNNRASIIQLDRTPLISISSVKYIAEDASTLTTISSGNYSAISVTDPGAVFFASDYELPTPNPERPDAIQIEFVAGYADLCDTPPLIRHAIKMLVAHWYENRLPVAAVNLTPIPMTLRDIIHNQRREGHFA